MLKAELQKVIRPASVSFNEAEHTYVHKSTGEFYTGCTTISDAWDKSFFLGPWYAKEMAEFILSKPYDEVIRLDPKSFATFITHAKGAAKAKSEKAKDDGTAAHDWIEACIASAINHESSLQNTPVSPEAQNAINAFCSWKKNKDIVWLASEEVLSSDAYRIAGKLDALAIIDGIPTLVDFKTSGQISASYLLQCAGYDIMLAEMGFRVRQYLILRIPKDGAAPETLTITDRDEMKFLKETFLHQREAHKYYVYAENKLKDASTHKLKTDDPIAITTPRKGTKTSKQQQIAA